MQKADFSETFAFLDREGLSEVPLEKRRLGMPYLQQYRVVHFPSFLKFLRPRVSRKERGEGGLGRCFPFSPFYFVQLCPSPSAPRLPLPPPFKVPPPPPLLLWSLPLPPPPTLSAVYTTEQYSTILRSRTRGGDVAREKVKDENLSDVSDRF